MFKQIPAILVALLATISTLRAESDLRLPPLFSDHMVLQQGEDIPVWGWAKPGSSIRITVQGETARATADEEGQWIAYLPSLVESNEPLEMTIHADDDVLTLKDVLIGDVWLCAGQSNMAMGVGATKRAEEIIADADRPGIRLFVVRRNVAFEPSKDFSPEQGYWVVCSPEGIMLKDGWKGFSAVGYFFGKAIQESQNRPIGLIGSYVGGSNIRSWVPIEVLENAPRDSFFWKENRRYQREMELLPEKKRVYIEEQLPAWKEALAKRNAKGKADLEAWRKAVEEAKANGTEPPKRPPVPKVGMKHPQPPHRNFHISTSLYNGQIYPIAPFALSGVIWYQGEANTYPGMVEDYAENLQSMIGSWRELWSDDFPFYVVQLPNLKSDKDQWPAMREAQAQAVNATPGTALAVTYDIGDPNDLHPAEKEAVGERLALLARQHTYGEDLVATGPRIQSAQLNSDTIVLTFEEVGSGLMCGVIEAQGQDFRASESKESLQGFEVAGADDTYYPAEAMIQNDFVILRSPIPSPQSVRYAWASDPVATLYNREGLPAAPFQIAVTQ